MLLDLSSNQTINSTRENTCTLIESNKIPSKINRTQHNSNELSTFKYYIFDTRKIRKISLSTVDVKKSQLKKIPVIHQHSNLKHFFILFISVYSEFICVFLLLFCSSTNCAQTNIKCEWISVEFHSLNRIFSKWREEFPAPSAWGTITRRDDETLSIFSLLSSSSRVRCFVRFVNNPAEKRKSWFTVFLVCLNSSGRRLVIRQLFMFLVSFVCDERGSAN